MPTLVEPARLGRGGRGLGPRTPTKFPLKVSASKRYLVDQNGVPFLGVGDAAWFIATASNLTNAQAYLASRQALGFTMCLVEGIDNIVNANGTGQDANGNMPFNSKQGGGSYTNSTTQSPDFSTPNSSYWAALDARLNLIAASGMLILFYPFWLGNPIGDPTDEGYYNALNASSQSVRQNFGTFVAQRYGAGGSNPIPGLIWGIGGDNDASNASGITAINNDIAGAIVAQDPAALCFADGLDGSSMIDTWHAQSWFKANGVYTDQLIGNAWTYAQAASEYGDANGTYPCFQKEGAYEGEHSSTPQFVRSQSWQAMLGGCWGFCFGNNPTYLFTGGSWSASLGSRGALDSQVLGNFFRGRRWDLLVPDSGHSFLTNGGSYSNATYASAALASDGSWGAVYAPTTETLTVALSSFSAPTVVAWWLDPTSGNQTMIGSFANSGSHSFIPPSTNDQGDADQVLFFG